MFIDEARIGAMIDHPNLVEHLELGQVGTELFLVMEYLEGENLAGVMRRLIKRGERLDYALAAYIAAEAGLGLHAAHVLTDDCGKPLHVVHRDVSPSNIFVTFRGEVKVLDFGIATAAQRLTQHTATGELKGKLSYMSPEQCRGETLDARSDIFSLGIVLYELSLVKRLFKRDNEPLTLNAVCAGSIPLPSSEDPRSPEATRGHLSTRARAGSPATLRDGEGAARRPGRGDDRAGPAERPEHGARARDAAAVSRPGCREVRAGHARPRGLQLGAIPASDVDEHIDVPGVTRGSSASRELTDAPTRVDRRHRTSWVVALVLLLALGAGGAWYAARRPRSRATELGRADDLSRAGDRETSTATAAPAAPAGVEISVESQPPGNVLVDGNPMGMSPLRSACTASTLASRSVGLATSR